MQFAPDNFELSKQIGKYWNMGLKHKGSIPALNNQKYKIICLKDSETIQNLNQIQEEINRRFEGIFLIKQHLKSMNN